MTTTQFFSDVGSWLLKGSERSGFLKLAERFGETPKSRQAILEAISMRHFASEGLRESPVSKRTAWISAMQQKYPALLKDGDSATFVASLKRMIKDEGLKLSQGSFGDITPLQVLRLLKEGDAGVVLKEMSENTFRAFATILGTAGHGGKLDALLPQMGLVIKYGYRPIGIAVTLGTLLGGYSSYLLISTAIEWMNNHEFSPDGMSDAQVQSVVEDILQPLGSELGSSIRQDIVRSTIGFAQVLNAAHASAVGKTKGQLPANYLSNPLYKAEREQVTLALANYVARISTHVAAVKKADDSFWANFESTLSEVEEATGTKGLIGNQDGRQILSQKATGQISKFDPSLLVQVDAARFDSVFVDRCLALRDASANLRMNPKQVLALLNLASVDATYQRAMVIALSRGLI